MLQEQLGPTVYGAVIALGATLLAAAICRLIIGRLRPIPVARSYAVLLAIGFSYGRFTGLEALYDPETRGTTIGAIVGVMLLCAYWRSRARDVELAKAS